jgi:hypothetical protein
VRVGQWLCGAPLALVCWAAITPQSAVAELYWVQAPQFAPPATGHIPEFGDLDADGDSDLIYAVVLQSYRNVGSTSAPSWQQDDSLVAGVDYENSMTCCLADLDADGDLDLSVGMLYGEAHALKYYENVGTAAAPAWQPFSDMYHDLGPGSETCPELADLDSDGDLDLVLAVGWGLRAYRNDGTPQVPSWSRDDSLVDVPAPYECQDPNLGDLDGDGDLDLVMGGRWYDGPIMCYENIGTAQQPTWLENETMLEGVDRDVEGHGLDLADLDGDGDLDMLSWQIPGEVVVYLNCGPITLAKQASSWGKIKALFR